MPLPASVQGKAAETSGGSTGGAWHGEIPNESRKRDHGRQIIHAMQTIKNITSVPFAFSWFKSRFTPRGGWGRRPKGDAPRSEASALGARWLSPARPQPPSSCHLRRC